jgi:hypothetical protein
MVSVILGTEGCGFVLIQTENEPLDLILITFTRALIILGVTTAEEGERIWVLVSAICMVIVFPGIYFWMFNEPLSWVEHYQNGDCCLLQLTL